MRKFLFFLLFLIIGFVIFGFVIASIGWQAILQPLVFFRYWQGITIFSITLFWAVLNILRWKFILKTQGNNLPFSKIGSIWLSGYAIAYLTPIAMLGGEVSMSIGLKKGLSLSWQKSIASVLILRILNLTSIFLLLLFGFISFFVLTGLPLTSIASTSIVMILGLAIIGIILAIFYHQSFRKKSILRQFLKIFSKKFIFNNSKGFLNEQMIFDIEKELFSFFKLKNKAMWQGLGITFLSAFLNLGRLWLILFFLGAQLIGIFQILAIFTFVYVAYVMPFPAALGSLEAGQVFVFSSLGLGVGMATAFSLILRGADFSLALVGIFFLIKSWIKGIFDRFFKKSQKYAFQNNLYNKARSDLSLPSFTRT